MKISDAIKVLEEAKDKLGDIDLMVISDGGVSPWSPEIIRYRRWPEATKDFVIQQKGY